MLSGQLTFARAAANSMLEEEQNFRVIKQRPGIRDNMKYSFESIDKELESYGTTLIVNLHQSQRSLCSNGINRRSKPVLREMRKKNPQLLQRPKYYLQKSSKSRKWRLASKRIHLISF